MGVFVSNGDSLGEELEMCDWHNYSVINCRECLIVGPSDLDLDIHFRLREQYLSRSEDQEKYYDKVVQELSKIKNYEPSVAIHLWFENDLFCQVNYWFCIYLFSEWGYYNLFLVKPIGSTHKADINFGQLSCDELLLAYQEATPLDKKDIQHGVHLWEAYVSNNLEQWHKLPGINTKPFENSHFAIELHIERIKDPYAIEKKIAALMLTGNETFEEVFLNFQNLYPLYGFGDTQLYQLYQDIKTSRNNNYAS